MFRELSQYGRDVAQKPTKRMGREERRAALLAAAGDVLRRPDAPLTFETIAETAGVSATLPYKYFGSVDEVALALYEQFVQEIDDATDALLATPDADFDTKVRGGMRLWLDAVERDGLLLERLTGSDAPRGLRRSVARRRSRVAELWAREIVSTFGLTPEDAAVAATALIAATSAVLQRIRIEGLDRDATVAAFVRMARGMCTASAV